jgi:hypothetical protein
MKIIVDLILDVDIDGWAEKYGFGNDAIGLTNAIRDALLHLGEKATYLGEESHFADVVKVRSASAVGRF